MAEITEHRIHINVQIEGVTDSSFLSELGNIYGPEHVLVYKVAQKRFVRLSDLNTFPGYSLLKIGKEILGSTPIFNNFTGDDSESADMEQTYSRSELPPDTAAVCGHFTPSLFKGMIDNPFVSIILRDPLERAITLYDQWRELEGETDWRFSLPFDPGLDFPTFATEEDMVNFQSKSLGSKRLGDFDLVGVAECLPGYIAQLKNKKWTGYLDQVNEGYRLHKPRYKKLGIDSDFLEKFKELNEIDYAIHQQAKEFIGYCM